MCTGAGMIVDTDLNVYFIEPDFFGNVSHSEILRRLDWKEDVDPFTRRFARTEYPDWTVESFRFDEEYTLPGWVEENRTEIIEKCNKILVICGAAFAEYKKVRDAARDEYDKGRDAAWAEYKKVRAAAQAEYEKVRAAAQAEYEKVRAPAWAEYEKVCAPAWAEYEKVRDAAMAEMIAKFERIAGYVKP